MQGLSPRPLQCRSGWDGEEAASETLRPWEGKPRAGSVSAQWTASQCLASQARSKLINGRNWLHRAHKRLGNSSSVRQQGSEAWLESVRESWGEDGEGHSQLSGECPQLPAPRVPFAYLLLPLKGYFVPISFSEVSHRQHLLFGLTL